MRQHARIEARRAAVKASGARTQAELEAIISRLLAREMACERKRDACVWESPSYWHWHDKSVALRLRAEAMMP